jgi:hypothetical protein
MQPILRSALDRAYKRGEESAYAAKGRQDRSGRYDH